jgi:hypothetical protein
MAIPKYDQNQVEKDIEEEGLEIFCRKKLSELITGIRDAKLNHANLKEAQKYGWDTIETYKINLRNTNKRNKENKEIIKDYCQVELKKLNLHTIHGLTKQLRKSLGLFNFK